jgi:hypothetical protein
VGPFRWSCTCLYVATSHGPMIFAKLLVTILLRTTRGFLGEPHFCARCWFALALRIFSWHSKAIWFGTVCLRISSLQASRLVNVQLAHLVLLQCQQLASGFVIG